MASKTIDQLANEFNVGSPQGTLGAPLLHQYIDPRILKVDARYQRVISRASLKKQGKFDWRLAVPAVVAKRPDSFGEQSGYYVIDGQHKAIKLVQSGSDQPMPCSVYVHPEDASYDDCMKKEAELFFAINTLRKSLSPIEKIRVGVQIGDQESLHVEQVMKTLNLQFDGFGSDPSHNPPPTELKAFTLFQHACSQNDLATMQEAYVLLLKMYPRDLVTQNGKQYSVTGPALYTCVLLNEFMNTALSSARKEAFYAFVTNKFRERYSMNSWTNGFATFSGDRYALHRLLEDYRLYCENMGEKSCYRIGDETLTAAVKVNARFANPVHDKEK